MQVCWEMHGKHMAAVWRQHLRTVVPFTDCNRAHHHRDDNTLADELANKARGVAEALTDIENDPHMTRADAVTVLADAAEFGSGERRMLAEEGSFVEAAAKALAGLYGQEAASVKEHLLEIWDWSEHPHLLAGRRWCELALHCRHAKRALLIALRHGCRGSACSEIPAWLLSFHAVVPWAMAVHCYAESRDCAFKLCMHWCLLTCTCS